MTSQNHPHLVRPKYRPDIDGLRAVAILAVVLFHAFPDTMRGGFIGVDIFFVISGFLISTIIFSSLEWDRFSLVEFYVRRAGRIFPALALVLVTSLVVGWFILFPDEYQQLGKHTAAGAAFVQNLTLWRESGYFDNSAETKPLLHLWSLAVEEQFYIFWPLLLAFVWNRHWNFLKITAGIGFVSFVTNIYLIQRHPTADFYLPLSRFWELMIGGVLAYIVLHKPQLIEKHKDSQSALGLLLIALGLLLLNKGKEFPGWWALLPTLGAFFIISAGPKAWFNQKLLANKLMVGIGLISYPLYLWHWPILSFLRIEYVEVSNTLKLLAVLVAFSLASLTYVLLEKPARFKLNKGNSQTTFVILLAFLAISGLVIYKNDSFSNSKLRNIRNELLYDRTRLGYTNCSDITLQNAGLGYCSLTSAKPIDSILIGDSHADDKFFGINKVDQKRSWILIGNHSCPPVLGINVETTVKDCQEKFKNIFGWIDRHPEVTTVVLSYFGNYSSTTAYAADHKKIEVGPNTIKISSPENLPRFETFSLGLKNAIQKLINNKKTVVVLVDIPELPYFPRDCERQGIACAIPIEEVLERQTQQRKMLLNLQRDFPSLLVFDPKNIFCTQHECSYKNGTTLMYRDSHHLTLSGSELYGKQFIEWLNKH